LDRESLEAILLDQFIQVEGKEFKYQTKVILVIEGVFQAKDMVLIIDIHLLIQLVKTENKHMLFGGQSICFLPV
jgi:hypothetical protein